VNDSLLPNKTLEPGFPKKRIGVETAQKWMDEIGFQVLTATKRSCMNDLAL
jgi:hypothetical protein